MVKICPRNRQRKQNVFRHALHRPTFGQRCGQYGGECAGSRPLRCEQNRFELRLPRAHRQQTQRRRNPFKRAGTDIPHRQNAARTFARTYSAHRKNAARLRRQKPGFGMRLCDCRRGRMRTDRTRAYQSRGLRTAGALGMDKENPRQRQYSRYRQRRRFQPTISASKQSAAATA